MGKRHRVEPQRTAGARKVLLVAGALALVAVLGIAGYRVATGQKLWCSDHYQLRVAADPAIVEQVRELAAQTRDVCADLDVQAQTGADLAGILADRGTLPDLWVAATPVEAQRVSRDAQLPFDTVINSVAASPVVIAAKNREVARNSWTAALATPELRVSDPVYSSVADSAMLAGAAEVEAATSNQTQLDQAMAVLAQGQSGRPGEDEAALLEELSGSSGVAVVSESDVVRAGEAASGVEAIVPDTGATALTFPLVISAQDPDRRDAAREVADAFGRHLGDEEFRNSLEQAGLRTADLAPLSDGRGVGEVRRLVVHDPSVLDRTLRTWRLLSLPTRAIALVDSSASMGFEVPGTDTTRMGVMVQALSLGLGLFGDNAALGLWSFSSAETAAPFRELVPVARNDSPGTNGNHRGDIAAAINELPQGIGGGTDLYTSVLAAVTAVRDSYDPNAINSVLLFSDGANDATSTMSEAEFLAQLKEIQDPARPVIVVTVGIMEDADPATLATIAEATAGSSHIARTPEEIPDVFANAIARRGAAGAPGVSG